MEKIYKLSLFTLCCAFLCCTLPLNGQNLLENPDFESGELAPWVGSPTLVEDAQNGSWAATGNLEQFVNLTGGVNYTLTVYAKNATPDLNVWVGITGDDGLVKNHLFQNTDYEKQTVDFSPPTDGSYKIWVWGVNGTAYTSDNFVLLAEGTTSVFDNEETAKIDIRNNVEGIMIDMDQSIRDAKVLVYDLSGQMIYQRALATGNTLIHTNEWALSGIYVVSVQTSRAVKTEKVFIP